MYYSKLLFLLPIDSGEDAQEEFGWKLVHGDVFRPPRKGMLLSVFLGSGTQILCMIGITLVNLFFSLLSKMFVIIRVDALILREGNFKFQA